MLDWPAANTSCRQHLVHQHSLCSEVKQNIPYPTLQFFASAHLRPRRPHPAAGRRDCSIRVSSHVLGSGKQSSSREHRSFDLHREAVAVATWDASFESSALQRASSFQLLFLLFRGSDVSSACPALLKSTDHHTLSSGTKPQPLLYSSIQYKNTTPSRSTHVAPLVSSLQQHIEHGMHVDRAVNARELCTYAV